MKIRELDESYRIQRNLSKIISTFDEQGKFIDRCIELNYILQCLSICELSEEEYHELRKSIEKLNILLHEKYDDIIQERREQENDKNRN